MSKAKLLSDDQLLFTDAQPFQLKVYNLLWEETWTQGAYERALADGSVCRCLTGWIYRVYGFHTPDSFHALNRVRNVLGVSSVFLWNDAEGRTFSEVMVAAMEANV